MNYHKLAARLRRLATMLEQVQTVMKSDDVLLGVIVKELRRIADEMKPPKVN